MLRLRARLPFAAVLVVAGLAMGGCSTAPPAAGGARTTTTSAAVASAPSTEAGTPSASPTFDRARRSVDDPSSPWVVVDKRRPLRPRSYTPRGLTAPDVPHTNAPLLRRPAARALERMFADARRDGIRLSSLSTYRSFESQRDIHRRNVATLGQRETDRLTLRPGFSEHQTGWAADLGATSGACAIQACFGSTPEGRWLAKHAWRHGWILRYPRGAERITGITWEPWHYRYVGAGLAEEYHDSGARTLEDLFGLPASPDYR